MEQLKGIAGGLGTTLPKLALAWVLHNRQVSVALCGTRRSVEIEEHVAALDVRRSPTLLQDIDTIMAGAAGLRDKVPT